MLATVPCVVWVGSPTPRGGVGTGAYPWLRCPGWRPPAGTGSLQTVVPGDGAGGRWARLSTRTIGPQSGLQRAARPSHPQPGRSPGWWSLSPALTRSRVCVARKPRTHSLVPLRLRVAGRNRPDVGGRAWGEGSRGLGPIGPSRHAPGHLWCGRLRAARTSCVPAGASVTGRFPLLLTDVA